MRSRLYHDQHGHFPIGTVSNPDLLPEKRLSWTVQFGRLTCAVVPLPVINKTKPWDAEENCPPGGGSCISMDSDEMREEPMGQVRIFLCPAVPVQPTPSLPSPTHFVGILVWAMTQLNCHCPTLEPGSSEMTVRCHARTSKTAWLRPWRLTEAMDGGPWTAGGRSTVARIIDGPTLLGRGRTISEPSSGQKTFALVIAHSRMSSSQMPPYVTLHPLSGLKFSRPWPLSQGVKVSMG